MEQIKPESVILTRDCLIVYNSRIEIEDSTVSFDEPGDIILRCGDDTGWLSVITHAAPVAQFSPSVLKDALNGAATWPASCVSLEPPPEGTPQRQDDVPSGEFCFMGWKVTVSDASQKFVYIIKSFHYERNSWIGAWPD